MAPGDWYIRHGSLISPTYLARATISSKMSQQLNIDPNSAQMVTDEYGRPFIIGARNESHCEIMGQDQLTVQRRPALRSAYLWLLQCAMDTREHVLQASLPSKCVVAKSKHAGRHGPLTLPRMVPAEPYSGSKNTLKRHEDEYRTPRPRQDSR